MPKTFVDWCTVIGLALAVWVVSSKPRTALKRWTLNWWANRSRINTEKRIQKLQTALAKAESLPLLTEFEDRALLGLSGLFVFLCLLTSLEMVAYNIAYSILFPNKNTTIIPTTRQESLLTILSLLGILVVLTGFAISRSLESFRLPRSSKYRDTVRKNIEELQARLK